MTAFYVQGLQADEDEVVIESLEALGKQETSAALAALYSCLSHDLSSIRLKALEAIDGRYADGQAKQIAKTLKDPDEENRLLALSICSSVVDKELAIDAGRLCERQHSQSVHYMNNSSFLNSYTSILFLQRFSSQ